MARCHIAFGPSFSAAAAVIGGAGIVLAAPAAALLADPPQAQAGLASFPSLFGAGLCAAGFDAAGFLNPVFAIFGQIPVVNIFVAKPSAPYAASEVEPSEHQLLVGRSST